MKKGKKIILVSLLLGSAMIILLIGIFQKGKPTVKYENFVVNVNGKEYKIQGNQNSSEITVKLSGEEYFEISLPKSKNEGTWAIDQSVYSKYFGGTSESEVVGLSATEAEYITYDLNIFDHNLESVSFKRTDSKNVNFENIPYTYLLTVKFEYEELNELKNVFSDSSVCIDSVRYYSPQQENDAYIEILFEEEIVDEVIEQYADDYEINMTIYFGEDRMVKYSEEMWKLGQSHVIKYILDDDLESLEKGIANNDARIAIEFIPISNRSNSYIDSMMIEKGN